MADSHKIIRITCEGADSIPLKEFESFQGQLKWLEEKQYEKLKKSIIEDGFHDPIHIWKKKGEKKPRKMLDGHQRIRTINAMIRVENFILKEGVLPVVWIVADTEKQAKRIVLEKMSQYGKYDEDTLYKFINDSTLDYKTEIKEMVDWPAIHMGKFEVGWYTEPTMPNLNELPKKSKQRMIQCPSCGHEWSEDG